jgi:hypothetical protein
VPGVFVRRGRGLIFERFDAARSQSRRRPSIALVKALRRAHHWRGFIEAGEVHSYYELARHEQMNPGYVRRMLQLAFLSPVVVEAILANHPINCRSVVELGATDIPLSWRQQEALILSTEEPMPTR